jgi:hypothetical protein
LALTKEKEIVTTARYQAIDRLISESRDLSAYQDIEAWSQRLCELFELSVQPFSNSSDFALNTEVEVMVNNYTFMLVFMGESQKSQQILERVIRFWVTRYLQTKNSDYLLKTLQPSINLSRLFLMKGDYESFSRVMSELSIEDNNGKIILGKSILDAVLIKDHLKFVKYASFRENLKAYLKLKEYRKILSLENELSEDLCKTIYYREAQIIALFNHGKYSSAESIIRGVMYKTAGVEQNIFYYRLYESYMCQGKLKEAAVILHDIKEELTHEPLDNLKDLMFATTVIKESRLLPNDPFSKKVLSGYKVLNDEMNYGNLLLWFHKNFKTDKIEAQLYQIHQVTHYQFLRRSIGSELGLQESVSQSPWNNTLDEIFNVFFTI